MNYLKPFEAFDHSLESVLRNFFSKPLSLSDEPEKMAMRIDISENDEAYTVHAEMPGLKKEDIKIALDGNQVTISAETRKDEEKKEDGKQLYRERYYGALYRSFTLAQPVNDAEARATYKDGVLELLLPKRNTTPAKQLTVQ